jgi:hypothetical protein
MPAADDLVAVKALKFNAAPDSSIPRHRQVQNQSHGVNGILQASIID